MSVLSGIRDAGRYFNANEHEGTFRGDGTVLYLDFGGNHSPGYTCQII